MLNMKQILNAVELRKRLTDELRTSSSVVICSAFITKAALAWLLEELSESTKLVVVGRFLPRDFLMGSSDLESIRMLLSYGAKVRAHATLHAKIIMLDRSKIYLGSANYTARGLALANSFNLEASVQLIPQERDLRFIDAILNSSFEVTKDTLELFEQHTGSPTPISEKDANQKWPATFFQEIKGLYVKDFPLAEPGCFHQAYEEFEEGCFTNIYKNMANQELSKTIFLNSKIYGWLTQLLSKDKYLDGIHYGALTKIIHTELLDDPKPYRSSVKKLQSNLYKFLELYAGEEMQIFVPGQRSQFLRLNNAANASKEPT